MLRVLPTIEDTPPQKLVLSENTLCEALKRLADKGWTVKLTYFHNSRWRCEIHWTYPYQPTKEQQQDWWMLRYDSSYGHKTALEAFRIALKEMNEKLPLWHAKHPSDEEAKPQLTIVAERPKTRRRKRKAPA